MGIRTCCKPSLWQNHHRSCPFRFWHRDLRSWSPFCPPNSRAQCRAASEWGLSSQHRLAVNRFLDIPIMKSYLFFWTKIDKDFAYKIFWIFEAFATREQRHGKFISSYLGEIRRKNIAPNWLLHFGMMICRCDCFTLSFGNDHSECAHCYEVELHIDCVRLLLDASDCECGIVLKLDHRC